MANRGAGWGRAIGVGRVWGMERRVRGRVNQRGGEPGKRVGLGLAMPHESGRVMQGGLERVRLVQLENLRVLLEASGRAR